MSTYINSKLIRRELSGENMAEASEHAEQVSLMAWWHLWSKQNAPGVLLYAIPNGGARNLITGRRLKAEGVMAGIPDLFLAAPRGAWHGLFLELKRNKGGRVSEAQKAVMARLEGQGYRCLVAHGVVEARQHIENYMKGGLVE